MKYQFKIIFILLITTCCHAFSQKSNDLLTEKIQQIISTKQATVGVSIIGNNGKDKVSINADKHYPLQSVFKLHIALAVLSEIDKGKFSLHQKVKVTKKELLPDFWSPLRDENPNGGSFTIAKLIQYSVSQSDNVACDVLIRLLGNPKAVEEYFKKNNIIEDLGINFTEEEMQSKWENMFQNWTTPDAASELLMKFYLNKKNLLSKKSYNFIWKTLRETNTGEDRLKGELPKGTIVAHKTGYSGTNKEGITAAFNDIGIVFLPNGEYFIISVFVTDSKENNDINAKIIADISKAAWDFFKKNNNHF
jgi:beta-lactamase class A/beta-lactamase class A VEB